MGLGDVLQKALGLGLSGVQSAAEGLGLAQPQQQPGMFGAPAQYQPTDLSDLNALQQLSLRFQNAVASSEGKGFGVASGAVKDQRATQNKERTAAFQQGIKLLQDFDAIRDKASPADYDRVSAMLRKRFGEIAGGQPGDADQFYDSFMSGGAGNTAGLLKLIATDPGAQQIIEMGGGVGELRTYAMGKIKDGIVFGDTEELEKDRAQLRQFMLGGGEDLDLRKAIEATKLPGGGYDLDQVLGALGDRLTASQRARLKRHEVDLTGEGFVLSPEMVKKRESGHTAQLQQETDAARIQKQHDLDMIKLQKEADLGKFKGSGPGGSTAQQRAFAKDTLTQRTKWREAEGRIDQFLKTPYNGPGSYQIINGWISGLDNTAAREGEVQVVRQEAAALADRLRLKLQQVTQGGVISEQMFDEIKGLMRGTKERIREQHRQYLHDQVQIGKSLFGEEGPDALIPGWRETLSGADENAPPAPGAVQKIYKGQSIWVLPQADGTYKPVK